MKIIITTLILCGSGIILNGCSSPYLDGIYKGHSQSVYTSEPYVGFVKLEVKNGVIISVEYKIVDTLAHETFDSLYEKHYIGNEEYIQQCRNDWKGVKSYPGELIKMQDPEKIDAISGATWSGKIFKQSAIEALKNAKKQKSED